MLWYLIKTWVGREEELVKEIRKNIPSHMYHDCFVIYQERIWRKQQRSIVHTEPLFPGCVFLTSQEKMPASSFLPMTKEDGTFLEELSGNNHIVKLSYVGKDEAGNILALAGPLKALQDRMERCQLKKRYAIVRHRLWGEDRGIVLGIILKEDTDWKVYDGFGENSSGAELPTKGMA